LAEGSVADVADMQTMVRTKIAVDGRTFLLAQGQDLTQLKHQIEAAASSRGTFISFAEVGNRSVSVLITAQSRVVMTEETVQYDDRDDGDFELPFGGMYDF
jgi:hypothetical protein